MARYQITVYTLLNFSNHNIKIRKRIFISIVEIIDMKPLYTQEQFEQTPANGKLLIECYQCGKPFSKSKNYIQCYLKHQHYPSYRNICLYCSPLCRSSSQDTRIEFKCAQCNKSLYQHKRNDPRKKSTRRFCSSSCAAIYNNAHKTKGCRISKLENYLAEFLKTQYSHFNIHFNRKDTINSELDIYIPELKLAFELNGIFHYEPIFGKEKLSQVKNNDQRKFQACLENGIELCIIDVSSLKYFKPDRAQKFLQIITDLIDNKVRVE